jgi:hypothetical protein
MSGKVVQVHSSRCGGTTMVDLDRCQEFSFGPPINQEGLPVDWSQYHIYYLTPDLRWILEWHLPGRVSYLEISRNDVRNHALRVGCLLLPPELQTEDLRDKETTANPLPPSTKRPSRPGAPTVTFFADPEEFRRIRGVSNGTVKPANNETAASPPTPTRGEKQSISETNTHTIDTLPGRYADGFRFLKQRMGDKQMSPVMFECQSWKSVTLTVPVWLDNPPQCPEEWRQMGMDLFSLRGHSTNLAARVSTHVPSLGISPQPILDFISELESQAVALQKQAPDKTSLSLLRGRAFSVVNILERALESSLTESGSPPRDIEKPAAVPASGTEAPQINPPHAAASGDAKKTERRVAEKLRDDPHAKSDEIFKATGISAQRVRNTDAWKANRKLLEEPHQQRRTVSLSDEMLAVRDSGASDPADIAAEREESERQKHARARDPEAIEPIEMLRRRYLEGANSDQRARFNRLNEADREHELTAWRLTGDRIS